MNIYQMQALDYVLKESYLSSDIDFSYQIVFKLNDELMSGDFLGVFENSSGELSVHENLQVGILGDINFYDYYPRGESSPISRLNNLIYPRSSGPSGRAYSQLIKKGISLPMVFKTLKPLVENLDGENDLESVVYNLHSLDKGYNLPFLFVNEDDNFEWVSLNKIDK